MAVAAAAVAGATRAARSVDTVARSAGEDLSSRIAGLVLVSGANSRLTDLCLLAPEGFAVKRVDCCIASLKDAEAILEEAQAEYPDLEIAGLMHVGGAAASNSAGDIATGAAPAFDESLRSLSFLVSALVPRMRKGARLLAVSCEEALQSPARWGAGRGASVLATHFMEQYMEALAHELRETGVTVYGMRFTDAAARMAEDARERLVREISEVWQLPHREAHGVVFPVGRPAVTYTSSSARGGSVLGASVDVRWAFRAAAERVAEYPAAGRPSAYQELANALRTEEDRLVWCHGASDVILRVGQAAAKLGGAALSSNVVLVEGPTWPNVKALLRSAGLTVIEEVPYPDPWASADAPREFWEALRRRVSGPAPPAMVYLVHPHFPSGVKDPDFGTRLEEVRGMAPATIFAIDQTYLGFTETSSDDELLLSLAEEHDNVVLIRSLSKVEGLAAVRLGWAQATPNTARAISAGLPFAGQLYISELALAGALAALKGPAAPEHRRAVRLFYEEEQQWLRKKLEELGFETFASKAPFFVLRGPARSLEAAVKAGAAIQRFDYPGDAGDQRRAAVCLVTDRASNETTLRSLQPEPETENPLSWAADVLKPMMGG